VRHPTHPQKIILMLADDMACNPRNPFAASVFNNRQRALNLYGDDIEVDYRGYDVNVENTIRVLSGRHPPHTPRSKRLLTDENSNVVVFLSGHGGDEFLKFQDEEEISSNDLADAFAQMHAKRRYSELLFIIDTCQARTLYNQFYSPNVLAIGSSMKDENSYSHHADSAIGVAVIDRFTYYTLEYFEQHHQAIADGTTSMAQLFESYSPEQIASHVGWRDDLMVDRRNLRDIPVRDFFGAAGHTVQTAAAYPER
jgi:GPI-anchor transamidase subunit K